MESISLGELRRIKTILSANGYNSSIVRRERKNLHRLLIGFPNCFPDGLVDEEGERLRINPSERLHLIEIVEQEGLKYVKSYDTTCRERIPCSIGGRSSCGVREYIFEFQKG